MKTGVSAMARVVILLFDSFGIGELPDAKKFGDAGANTLLHIAEYCASGAVGASGAARMQQGQLVLPNLNRFGLHLAAAASSGGKRVPGFDYAVQPQAMYGYAAEISYGKDTPSGHWEITGVPVLFDWGYFPPTYPSFPQELVDGLIKSGGVPGILGNCHASGTEIIQKYGDEHVRSGKPICYTSADSVFQIAVHEEAFGLERLYEFCKVAYDLVKPYHIGRVIARPFLGASGSYKRTEHRRDYSVPPPAPTLLDKLVAAGREVIAIGKISDIFAHQGISRKVEAYGNDNLFAATLQAVQDAPEGSLIFTNFVDFDMQYGHRRDIVGYADALEKIDERLPELEKILRPDDIVIITADHGCDPTFKGSDHTREYIPVIVFGAHVPPRNIGKRETFADIGQSIASYLGIEALQYGASFI
jgi:phosphopentomutase